MISYLGEYVRTKIHNNRGRIYKKYNYYSESQKSENWFNMQKPGYSKSVLSEPWYSILCKDGGTVLVPECEIIAKEAPYFLNNAHEENQFGDNLVKDEGIPVKPKVAKTPDWTCPDCGSATISDLGVELDLPGCPILMACDDCGYVGLENKFIK